MARVPSPTQTPRLPLLYGHRSTSAERLLRVLGNARRQDAQTGRFRRLPTSRRLTRGRLSKLFGSTENEAMEDSENLKLEDMKALGLRIEKCVHEVLRSHLIERAFQYDEELRP